MDLKETIVTILGSILLIWYFRMIYAKDKKDKISFEDLAEEVMRNNREYGAPNSDDPYINNTFNYSHLKNSSATRSQAQFNSQQPSTANYRPKYTQGTSSSNQSNPASNNTSQFNSRSTAQGSVSTRNQATPTQNNYQQGTNQAAPRPNATQNNTGSRQQPPQRNFQQRTNQTPLQPNAAQNGSASRTQQPPQRNFQHGMNQASSRSNTAQNNSASRTQPPPQRNFQHGMNQASSRSNTAQNNSASRTQPPPQRNFQQGTNQGSSRPNQPQNGSAARTQPPPKYTSGNSANSKTSYSGMQGSFGFFSGFAQEQEQEVKARRQTSQVEEVEAQRRAQEQAQREREQREREQREREQREREKREREQREREKRERVQREQEQREREEAQRRAAQAQNARNTQNTNQSRSSDPYYKDKLEVLHSLAYASSVILELTHSSDVDLMFEVLTVHANESINNFLFASEADKDALVLYAQSVILQAKMGILNPQNEHGQMVMETIKHNHRHLNLGTILIHLCSMACLMAEDLPQREREACLQQTAEFIAAFLVASGFNSFAVIWGIKLQFGQFGFNPSFDFGESQEEKIKHACEQLGIDRNISKEEFRRIKRNKLAQYHPDKAPAGRADEFKQKFQETSALLDIVESQWK